MSSYDYLTGWLASVGINEAQAETLIRLAVCTVTDGYDDALASFSDGNDVEDLAMRASLRIYPVQEG